MPRSPWLASPGCTKNDGVPVEASVAAILRDVPGFAHARDDDAPLALEHQLAGAQEAAVDAIVQHLDRARFGRDDRARAAHQLRAIEERVAERQGSGLHLGIHRDGYGVGIRVRKRKGGELLVSVPLVFEYHSPPHCNG